MVPTVRFVASPYSIALNVAIRYHARSGYVLTVALKLKVSQTEEEPLAEAKKDKLTIVMFSGDLDKALAGFILATTGASMGMEVSMFFTFWGLNVVKKNEGSIKSRGLIRNMF